LDVKSRQKKRELFQVLLGDLLALCQPVKATSNYLEYLRVKEVSA